MVCNSMRIIKIDKFIQYTYLQHIYQMIVKKQIYFNYEIDNFRIKPIKYTDSEIENILNKLELKNEKKENLNIKHFQDMVKINDTVYIQKIKYKIINEIIMIEKELLKIESECFPLLKKYDFEENKNIRIYECEGNNIIIDDNYISIEIRNEKWKKLVNNILN